ncbi:MAG: TetR/AcrR family transcriptional regulator [Candidatus Velthaea sp.]
MKHADTVPDLPSNPPDKARDVSGALLDAFRDLLLERGYRRVTVLDIVARARVARSTFYAHFDDKNDVLRRSIRPLLGILARGVEQPDSTARVRAVLEHFQDKRQLAAVMLRPPIRDVLAGFLAGEIEYRFAHRRRGSGGAPGPDAVPPALAAAQVAGAQLALIDAWLHERQPTSSNAVARALLETSRAMAGALFGD